MSKIELFLDSNVFLQCRALGELGWAAVAPGCDEIGLVVSRSVQREIDRLKQDGSARRSQRARRANALFRDLLSASGQNLVVRDAQPRVTLYFAVPAKLDDHGVLDLAKPDDTLIAEALAHRLTTASKRVALLTHDTGSVLTANHVGLQAMLVPDEWLLAPEPDARDKQIKALEQRLQAVERSHPIITFSTTSTPPQVDGVIVLDAIVFAELAAREVAELVELATTLSPQATNYSPNAPAPVGQYEWIPPTARKRLEYEQAYASWVESTKRFLGSAHAQLSKCSVSVAVSIANRGSVPARNVVVEIETTSKLEILPPHDDEQERASWRSSADAPTPPSAPEGSWRSAEAGAYRALAGFHIPSLVRDVAALGPNLTTIFPQDLLRSERDQHAFYWKTARPRVPENRWSYVCAEFRHQVEVEVFEFDVSASSCGTGDTTACIKIRVTASNLPEPATLRVPVEIRARSGNTLEAVRQLIEAAARDGSR